ncbi:MAG: carboxymuconolactone decarboxylase family protein [Rhizobiales bacterium]|nr:carboxymuconolactone decarboxylase family protein [Hyphomicrobiales bacterium]
MKTSYDAAAEAVNAAAATLTRSHPDAMRGFKALGAAAYADGALNRKTKELIALALSVAARCDGCVAYHARRASELGIARAEVVEALGIALQMGGGPSMVYGGEALAAFDTFEAEAAAA